MPTQFADRIRRAYDRLPVGATGRRPSHSSLERAAGLSKGTFHKILTGQRLRPSHDVLTKLASALRCSVADIWPSEVADAEGPRICPECHCASDSEPPSSARCPSREPILAALRADDADPGVIAALEAEEHEVDPGEDYWWSRLQHYRTKLAQARKPLEA